MTIASADWLAFAKNLNSSANCETDHRVVVGRAYYAAYQDCVDWHSRLSSPGSAGSGPGGVHEILCSQLTAPTVKGEDSKNSKMRGYRLRTLKTLRVKADYQLSSSLTDSEASQAITDAESIIGIV